MDLSTVELPSNKKFGFFFTLVFAIAAGYFYTKNTLILAYAFAAISTFFFLVTLVKTDLLLPFNKLWMRFGLLLGMIISPIVLGTIFFGIFAPVSFLMRLYGRDELQLKFKEKTTHWISCDKKIQADSFKLQF